MNERILQMNDESGQICKCGFTTTCHPNPPYFADCESPQQPPTSFYTLIITCSCFCHVPNAYKIFVQLLVYKLLIFQFVFMNLIIFCSFIHMYIRRLRSDDKIIDFNGFSFNYVITDDVMMVISLVS